MLSYTPVTDLVRHTYHASNADYHRSLRTSGEHRLIRHLRAGELARHGIKRSMRLILFDDGSNERTMSPTRAPSTDDEISVSRLLPMLRDARVSRSSA